MRRRALPSVCPYPRSKGSITTFAWVGDRFCTSMMRGFRKFVALLCIRGYLCQMRLRKRAPAVLRFFGFRLLRVKLDHQLFVHVRGELRAVGQLLERALEVRGIHLDPAREAVLAGEVERSLDAEL